MTYTTLGLAGVPSSEPFYNEFAAGSSRPDSDQFTSLGLFGAVSFAQGDFDGKDPAIPTPRPDGSFTWLSLNGAIGVENEYEGKTGAIGIYGRTTLTFTPSAQLILGRRHSIIPDVTISIKPVNAVITVAHRLTLQARTTVSVRPQASRMQYGRSGVNATYVGNNTTTITPFATLRHRTWLRISGANSVVITPRAALTYTAAGVKNHSISGRTVIQSRPSAVLEFADGGISFGISGGSSIGLTVNGRVQVTRQTTYATHGSVSLRFTPAATITKGIGPPVAYGIQGRTTLRFTPQANLLLADGIIQQAFITGVNNVRVLPFGRIRVERAPQVASLRPEGRRRLVRVR